MVVGSELTRKRKIFGEKSKQLLIWPKDPVPVPTS